MFDVLILLDLLSKKTDTERISILMSISKIVFCIVIGLVGFYAFLQAQSLGELKEKATKEEKKAIDKITTIAIFLPLFIMCFIMSE